MAIDVLRVIPPGRSLFRRARERVAADRWLEGRAHTVGASDAVRRRIAELTSPRERTRLAKSLLGAVRDARRPGLSAIPLDRRAVADRADELAELAGRLADLDRPVTAQAVALVHRLLTDGDSPLYAYGRGDDLPAELARIRAALEAR